LRHHGSHHSHRGDWRPLGMVFGAGGSRLAALPPGRDCWNLPRQDLDYSSLLHRPLGIPAGVLRRALLCCAGAACAGLRAPRVPFAAGAEAFGGPLAADSTAVTARRISITDHFCRTFFARMLDFIDTPVRCEAPYYNLAPSGNHPANH